MAHACPACGGMSRREIAPCFFECTTPLRQPSAAREPGHASTGDLCGEHYVDTSDHPSRGGGLLSQLWLF